MPDVVREQKIGQAGFTFGGRLLRHITDFFVPPLCLACRQPLTQHDAVCARCWQDIHFIVPPVCDRLGIPLPFDPGGGPIVSAAAAANPPSYDRARAVAHYDGVMRQLIHKFKYGDQHAPRKLFTRWLKSAAKELTTDCEVVTPVPLSRKKLRNRRFNQAALLAKDLAADSNLVFEPRLLARRKNTLSQVGLTRDQRKRNLQGAFEVPHSKTTAVEGRSILLVDDVITTGTTVEACARILKRAGAARIDVLALAIVTNESRIVL